MANENSVQILEKDLVTYCIAGVVTYMKLVPAQDGDRKGYVLHVGTKLSEKEFVMVAHNTKKPRVWANLDRAVKHYREVYRFEGPIQID